MFRKYCYKILFLCVLSLSLQSYAQSDDDKALWITWERNNPISTVIIDHGLWQVFLDKHLTESQEGLSLIHFKEINQEDVATLHAYIKQMSRVKVSKYNRDEQLAYWLNVHNALTIHTVIKHFPVNSIQHIEISPGFYNHGPWSAKLITVEGVSLSLNDIRNRIIRPIWNDPRTLYGLHDASIGAPNLFHYAFDGTKVYQQLNLAAKDYVNCQRGVKVMGHHLAVSKIYDWYEQDFGGSKQNVIEHIKVFAEPKLKKQLTKIKTIHAYVYNWHLNVAKHDIDIEI